jgi:SPP1 gp7 family putative phage head morphogenesis protein
MAKPDVERLMAEIAERWGDELARQLRRLGKRVIEEIAANPALLDDAAYWQAMGVELGGAIIPRATEVAWVGVTAGEAIMGFAVEWDMLNQAVLDYTRRYGFSLVNIDGDLSIVKTTRDQMREIFLRWQRGELGDRGLPDLVRALDPLFGSERARRIAVTETTRLFAEGNLIAWRTGGVTHKIWHTAMDELVCPICAPLEGKKVRLDAPFSPPVRDWNGDHPPAHVNCRCWLTCQTERQKEAR